MKRRRRRKCSGPMEMAKSARREWETIYPHLSAEQSGLLGAMTARAEAQTVRLALIYALLDQKDEIEVAHLRAALAVWEFCEMSVARIFGSALGDPIADEITRALQEAGSAGMTRTGIRDWLQRHQAGGRINVALALLAAKTEPGWRRNPLMAAQSRPGSQSRADDMGKYLDILKRGERDISDISDISTPKKDSGTAFSRFCRFGRTLSDFARAAADALERRCPEHVDQERWQQATTDARQFLARWSEKAAGLGWTAQDLLGLPPVPERPPANYQRLCRYDQIGLIWLLRGRPVLALTDHTAAIENPSGSLTVYRRHNKPASGPVGDSLDDFDPQSNHASP